MKFPIDLRSIDWWLWAATLALLLAAVAGWTPGYAAVMILSFVQIPFVALKTGSMVSFASQVRIAYFGLTLFGLWEAVRVYCFSALVIGTAMVVLFDRCSIALVLKQMPWNKNVNPQCKLP
jgi:hypothetical protein